MMPETLYNPFTGQEEILFKDEDGALKVLRGETVMPWEPPPAAAGERAVARDTLEPVVQKILAEVTPQLPDARLTPRLKTVLVSRLKDVRDSLETREVLLRSAAAGGLGLPPAVAEGMLRVIDQGVEEYHRSIRQSHDLALAALAASVGVSPASAVAVAAPPARREPLRLTPLPPQVPPATPPLPPVPPVLRPPVSAAPSPAAAPVSPSRSPTPSPFAPPPPAPRPVPPPQRVEQPPSPSLAVSPQRTPAPAPLPVTTVAPQPPPPPAAAAATPVRFRPKLTGPLEELREMTLSDFRRLDPNPANAAAKVKEKIALQEQESFAQKAKAIAAWRQSAVFRCYAELAGEAMAGKLPITEVIGRWQAAGQEVLTVGEFEAITDFNQTLRF